MVMDDSVLSMNQKSSSSSMETVSRDVVKVKREGTSEFQLPVSTGPVKLDCVLHASKIVHNLFFITGLCDDWTHWSVH